jgi:hypothetical protein
MKSCFGGAFGQSESPSGFGGGQSIDFARHEHRAIAFGQRFDCRTEKRAEFRDVCVMFRIVLAGEDVATAGIERFD